MTDYTEFDKALLAKIEGGASGFASLQGGRVGILADAIAGPRGLPSRVVDRRLQALRKKGLITYTPKGGWRLA